MHYVILITHQSDIKICTTNFQACLLASHTIRIPIRAQYVCATRRSLITFPFFFQNQQLPRVLGSLYSGVFIAHIDTTAGMASSCFGMPILQK